MLKKFSRVPVPRAAILTRPRLLDAVTCFSRTPLGKPRPPRDFELAPKRLPRGRKDLLKGPRDATFLIFFKDDPGRPHVQHYKTTFYKIRLDAVVEVSSPLIILSFTEDPSRGAARPSCLIHPKKEKSSVGRNDSISAFRSLGDRERTGGNIASCSWGASGRGGVCAHVAANSKRMFVVTK